MGDGIGQSQLEEDEMTYQRRHRMMTEEMTSIGELEWFGYVREARFCRTSFCPFLISN